MESVYLVWKAYAFRKAYAFQNSRIVGLALLKQHMSTYPPMSGVRNDNIHHLQPLTSD